MLLVLLITGLACANTIADTQQESLRILISKYSDSDSLTLQEFQELFKSLRATNADNGETSGIDVWCSSFGNSSCAENDAQCSAGVDVFKDYAVDSKMNVSSLWQALPRMMLAVEAASCRPQQFNESDNEIVGPRKPSTAETWGYSTGVVLIVVGLSNLGGLLAPLMKSAFFQKILMFLVALAIGTQAGAGIVVLIPESLHLMYIEETKDDYLWKVCSVLGGIIFVLVLERLLKLAFHHKKSTKERTVAEISVEAGSTTTISTNVTTVDTLSTSDPSDHVSNTVVSNGTTNNNKSNGVSNNNEIKLEETGGKAKQQIATVAWMVMLGDSIHKFVDGLSVGAAFTENITTGLTLAISILCEELPHELGDISILLHSGMTMKQALFYNTMAALMGIPGLIVGVFVGETTSANQWIFAIAGGIFIYVPLADMLPEMAHTIDKALKDGTGAILLCILQLSGLLMGFGIIVLVAMYAGDIEL